MAYSPLMIGTIKEIEKGVVNADGTADVVLFTAGANGSRIEHLTFLCTEAGKVVQIWRKDSGSANKSIIYQSPVTVAATVVDVLAQVYAILEKQYIAMAAGTKLGVNVTVAITAGQTLYIQGDGGDI